MQITRKIEFDAGHRLVGHESKCANLHGHRYVAEITVSAAALDSVGRVIDFSKIKELVGGWIDLYWDHNMLFNKNDPILDVMDQQDPLYGKKKPYLMSENPTAENMARVLLGIAQELLEPHGIAVDRIRLYETPNCWAEVTA